MRLSLFRALPVLALAAGLLLPAQRLPAQEEQVLTQKQQESIKKLVHDYLMENPGVIAEAIEALRQKEDLAAEIAAKKVLVERKDEIFNDPDTPVLGNPKGDVTLVEFFDYRCPYCKAMSDLVFETVKADGKVRLVMKEFPVLGPDSSVAAHAALAARDQKKYEEFHRALMHSKEPLSDKTIMKIAGEVGLNLDKLKKDMDDQKVDNSLRNNIKLAHELDISGTPGFIIGDQLIPGAISQQSLKQLIDQTRKSKS